MKTMMKNKILIVIASVLVLSLSVGFASAYFSDHEAAQGAATIQLGGKTEIVEEWDKNIKKISIENIGKAENNDTEVIVRVAIYGPKGMKVTANETYWIKDGNYYYYNGILQVGQKTPIDALTAEVDGIQGKDLGDNFDIVVMQESVQPTYEGDNNKVVKPAGWNGLPDLYGSY